MFGLSWAQLVHLRNKGVKISGLVGLSLDLIEIS